MKKLISKKPMMKSGTVKKTLPKAQIGRMVKPKETKKTGSSIEDAFREQGQRMESKRPNLDPGFRVGGDKPYRNPDPGFFVAPKGDYQPRKKVLSEDGNLEYLKKGGLVKKVAKPKARKK